MAAPLVLSVAANPLLAVAMMVLCLSVVLVVRASGDYVTELVVHLQPNDQRPNTQKCACRKYVSLFII